MEQQQPLHAEQNLRSVYFLVADHLIQVFMPMQLRIEKSLPTFAPFAADAITAAKPMLSVTLSTSPAPRDDPQAKLLSDISVIWNERFRFEETATSYITTIQATAGDQAWKMVSSKDFAKSIIYAPASELYSTSKFGWLIMIAYGQAALHHRTVLIHASVVKREGVGYLFLGKSGTGKSTHSRLWVENIEGVQLLNDDNPAIRVYENGKIAVFGTPWSGKTACYKQEQARLGAIIRLEQAPFNKLHWKQGKEALVTLLPSTSAIRWNADLFAAMLQTIGTILEDIPIGVLQCLPNGAAARLCYGEVVTKVF